jgi:FAD/FMN-containing dehydrogenase
MLCVRGQVITADHAAFDEARKVRNGMIGKLPALIVRCSSAGDVTSSVSLAREHNLLLAVRGGGHNVAGTSVRRIELHSRLDHAPLPGRAVDAQGAIQPFHPFAHRMEAHVPGILAMWVEPDTVISHR